MSNRQSFNFFQIFIVLLICLNVQSVYGGSERIALVIGNSAYQDSPLKNPVNDATDMAIKLTQLGFKVEKLLNADRRKMKNAISRFGKKLNQDNSIGLFYFAGHGVQVKGHNYLLPIRADIKSEADVEFEAVNADRVLSQMSEADNGLNMIILDACRNNPFARSFRSSTRGLARMAAPKGSLILYATSPGDVAADGSNRNGLFTEKLMQAMDKKGLKIEDVFKQTAIAVNQASEKQQVPYIEGVILGDFYFNGQLTIEAATVAADKTDSVENRFWDSVQKSASKEMYEAYLAEYPEGHYARLAHIQLERFDSNYEPEAQTSKVAQNTHSLATSTHQSTAKDSDVSPSSDPGTLRDTVIGMELLKIPSGCFQMGSPSTQEGRESDEQQHRVCISKDFYLGKYEVTQGQWKAIMGKNPSAFKKGDNYPVESITSDEELQTFITKLNAQTGQTYRLPTEAEWEYACRSGGKNQTYCGGEDVSAYGWHGESWTYGHHPVGGKAPNGLGLYDMSGNVREWVLDMYEAGYYQKSSVNDPKGSSTGSNRVTRGGTWNADARLLRSSDRFWIWPVFGVGTLGLRLARDL